MTPNFLPNADLSGCQVSFSVTERQIISQAAEQVRDLLKNGDETGTTSRLFPPAYGDDWMRQVEYDRLMHSELADSHVAALERLLELTSTDEVSTDDLLGVLRALNQIRLVLSKRLDLTDDSDEEDFPPGHHLHEAYLVYLYFGQLLFQALEAMSELTGPIGDDDDDIDLGGDDPHPN